MMRGFLFGEYMNIEASLRSLRTSSRIATAFSIMLVIADLMRKVTAAQREFLPGPAAVGPEQDPPRRMTVTVIQG